MIASRLALAFGVGLVSAFFVLGDAFSYSERMRPHNSRPMIALLLTLVLILVASFMLNRSGRQTVLIPFMMLLGLTITHTIVVIRELAIDPTNHNLLPFEYLFGWILVGIPALGGALFARALSSVQKARPE